MVDIARGCALGDEWWKAQEKIPYLGAAIARAQVLGFQGRQLGAPDRVLACVKHFAGYGAADGGRDYDSSYIPEEEMWNVYLPPFKAALDAGAGSVMSAYHDLNDVPASGNRWLLHDVLRDAWNFQGFVVSDAFAVRSLRTHGYARDLQDAAHTKSLHCRPEHGHGERHISQVSADRSAAGHIAVQQIDAAVLPILETKIRMGLFEHPFVDESRMEATLNDPAHRELARKAVQRSLVLLRNEGSLLPLDKSGKRIHSIAVIGSLGDDPNDQLSMWGALVKPGPTVSILQGIKNKVGSVVSVAYAHGPNLHRDIASPFENLPLASLMKEQPAQSPEQVRLSLEAGCSDGPAQRHCRAGARRD